MSARRKLTAGMATGIGVSTYANARYAGHSRKKSFKAAGIRASGVVGAGEVVNSKKASIGQKALGISVIHAGTGIAAHRVLHPNQRNFKTANPALQPQNRVRRKPLARVKRK